MSGQKVLLALFLAVGPLCAGTENETAGAFVDTLLGQNLFFNALSDLAKPDAHTNVNNAHVMLKSAFNAAARNVGLISNITPGHLEKSFSELYAGILQESLAKEDPEDRKKFLVDLLNVTRLQSGKGAIPPDEIVSMTASILGSPQIVQWYLRNKESALYAAALATVSYALFVSYQRVVLGKSLTRGQEEKFFHYFFASYVNSFGEGVIDTLATPVQMLVHPLQTVRAKPGACALCVGGAAGGLVALMSKKRHEKKEDAQSREPLIKKEE